VVHWRKDSRRGRKVLQIGAGYKLVRQKGQESGPVEFVMRTRTMKNYAYLFGWATGYMAWRIVWPSFEGKIGAVWE
jgi:hypothetical protein